MDKSNKRILYLGLFYLGVMILIAYVMPKAIDWSPSFKRTHTKPFGSEILHNELNSVFSEVKLNERPLYNSLKDETFTETNLLIVSHQVQMDSLDQHYLMEFVQAGNTAFIAAYDFPERLLDTLHVKNRFHWGIGNIAQVGRNSQRLSEVNFVQEDLKQDTNWMLQAPSETHSFVGEPGEEHKITGISKMDEDKWCFVKIPFGSGTFYLHSFPYAFTNYHLLEANNHEYVSACLSHLPNQTTIWDAYYKEQAGQQTRSPLSVLLKSKSFQWAYFIALGTLLLFMLFFAKRTQRVIPILKPYRNESLDFTKRMGTLYFEKGNNRDIFNKRVLMLKELLSYRYYLRDVSFSLEEARLLAKKSGRPETDVLDLFEHIQRLNKLDNISNGQLKAVVKRINKFLERDNH